MAAAPATRCAEKQERLAATAGSARAPGDWHCADGEWSLIIATVVVPMVIAAAAQYRLALR